MKKNHIFTQHIHLVLKLMEISIIKRDKLRNDPYKSFCILPH